MLDLTLEPVYDPQFSGMGSAIEKIGFLIDDDDVCRAKVICVPGNMSHNTTGEVIGTIDGTLESKSIDVNCIQTVTCSYNNQLIPVSYTHLTLPTICSV